MTNKINILIVDDDIKNIETIINTLNLIDFSFVYSTFSKTTVMGALEHISKNVIDILILDVQLIDGLGFEIIESENINIPTIFITAHEKYAFRAFKVNAIDFLLKPFSVDELESSLYKAYKGVVSIKKEDTSPVKNKISIRTLNGFEIIDITDIIYCKAEGNYTTIYLENRSKIMVSKYLALIEESLKEFSFYRIHSNCLVNLLKIKKYINGVTGQVLMSNSETLYVSKRRVKDFKSVFEKI